MTNRNTEQRRTDLDRDARRFRYVENSGAVCREVNGRVSKTNTCLSEQSWMEVTLDKDVSSFQGERKREMYILRKVFEEIENVIREIKAENIIRYIRKK